MEDDIAASLPQAPVPAPARRAAAIEQALQRFDAADTSPPASIDRPSPAGPAHWRAWLGVPQAGALVAAALVAVIGVPVAWESLRDRSIVEGSERRAEAAKEVAGPFPATDTAKPADATQSQLPAGERATLAGNEVKPSPVAEAKAIAAPAAAPVQLAQAASVPPFPRPSAAGVAEKRELAANRVEVASADPDTSADSQIVATGSRIARPSLEAASPMAAVDTTEVSARASATRSSSAKISERGDWNACTVEDPARSLAGCRKLVDPAAAGAGGRAAARVADGLSLAWSGDSSGAISAFDRAIEIEPRSAFAYLNRGLAYRRSGDLERALADLDRAVRYAPDAARGYYQRSLLLRQKGDLRGARADEDRAVNLDRRYATLVK